MACAGKDLWRTSSTTPLLKQVSWSSLEIYSFDINTSVVTEKAKTGESGYM